MLDGLNKFASVRPNLDIKRSRFDRDSTYKTTLKAGDIVPVFCDEVLPGDTFNLKTAFVCRMYTPVVPTLDNAFIDFYYFFVPNRIIAPYNGDDWEEICGENKSSYWAPSVEKSVTLRGHNGALSVTNGSVANYFGLPIGFDLGSSNINPYPFIAYSMIYDEWFRDQNTQSPVLTDGVDIGDDILSVLAEKCYVANKFHDLFTSCLPSPQKGDSVTLSLGDTAPVLGKANVYADLGMHVVANGKGVPVKFSSSDLGSNESLTGVTFDRDGTMRSTNAGSVTPTGLLIDETNLYATGKPDWAAYESTLYADLSSATATTINELRNAFAIQRMLEKDSRGGSRMREILKSHFGVTIGDSRVQVPEYLGGKRVPINVSQVLQSSSSTSDSPLGFTGAYSLTGSNDNSFVKSFTEHGYVIGVAIIRTMQSYSQGVPKMFTRFRRFDYYWPSFANIGEQPIYKDELFSSFLDASSDNRTVFGYQEAWAHYRYKPSMVTGSLSPNANDESFGAFTYTNDFSVAPTLNSDFMKQDKSVVDKTLVAVTDQQFVLDCYFKLNCVRVMPVESIPGLIDHH